MTINVADYNGNWNAAIAAAVANGAPDVKGNGGTYPVTTPIIIPETAKRLTIDFGWSLFDAVGYNGTVLKIADRFTAADRAENVTLRRFRINGSGGTDAATAASIGLEVGNSLVTTIEDAVIQNMGGRGVVADKPSAGSTTLIAQQLELNRVTVRWTGEEAFDIGRVRPLDSIIARNCFANHAGERLTSVPKARGGVYIAAYMADLHGWEVSGIGNPDGVTGFLNAMVVRKAAGRVSAMHFEDNCNNQPGSADLLLDTDANGLVVSGTSHSFGGNGARWCVETSSKGNRIEGTHSAGNNAQDTHDIIIHRNNATDCEVGPISYSYAPKNTPIYGG